MTAPATVPTPVPPPRHVAIIMDGNGRWAEQRGLDRPAGHAQGTVSVRETIRAACNMGLPYLTLYAFSAANWLRPTDEVEALMELLADFAVREAGELCERRVRVAILGETSDLPPMARAAVETLAEATTAAAGEHPAMVLSLALSYSSRRDLARAARRLLAQPPVDAREPDELALRAHLCTAALPDVDLLIRTGGEQRLSDFLLFEAAYAELYFTDVLWPDFRAEDLHNAVDTYARRERRFGRTGRQVRSVTG